MLPLKTPETSTQQPITQIPSEHNSPLIEAIPLTPRLQKIFQMNRKSYTPTQNLMQCLEPGRRKQNNRTRNLTQEKIRKPRNLSFNNRPLTIVNSTSTNQTLKHDSSSNFSSQFFSNFQLHRMLKYLRGVLSLSSLSKGGDGVNASYQEDIERAGKLVLSYMDSKIPQKLSPDFCSVALSLARLYHKKRPFDHQLFLQIVEENLQENDILGRSLFMIETTKFRIDDDISSIAVLELSLKSIEFIEKNMDSDFSKTEKRRSKKSINLATVPQEQIKKQMECHYLMAIGNFLGCSFKFWFLPVIREGTRYISIGETLLKNMGRPFCYSSSARLFTENRGRFLEKIHVCRYQKVKDPCDRLKRLLDSIEHRFVANEYQKLLEKQKNIENKEIKKNKDVIFDQILVEIIRH